MASIRAHHVEMACWVAFGLFGSYSLISAYKHLQVVRDATKVTKEERQPEIISQRTEDAISIATLGDILNSPNYDIRQAAVKIIVERVTRNENYSILLRNIKSRDSETRDMALSSLKFLCTSSVQDTICTYETYKVLIDLLRKFLPDVKKRNHHPDTDWKERTQAEKDTIYILDQMMHHNIREALRAGLVHRWLSLYPFGGSGKNVELKWQILSRLNRDSTDDTSLGGILNQLHNNTEGRYQLRKYGLINDADEAANDEFLDIMRGALTQRRAEREESEEEIALRRRRRQAMVISEAGEPLSRDNIYDGYEQQERVEDLTLHPRFEL